MNGRYHYGKTIKKYRELRKWTLSRLAASWPKVDGDEGVNIRYVQDVEAGRKHISDQRTVRKLARLLDIPLWEFGYSEYDPFAVTSLPGHGERMFHETLDVVGTLIDQTLTLRRIAPLPEVEKSAHSLEKLFDYYLTHLPPPSRLEQQFLHLYAQQKNIAGLMHFENKQYDKALDTFETMYDIAKQANDSVLIVHSLQKMGVELNRANRKQEAIQALEEARDRSFHTSKHVATFANAYLAHIYAASGDALRFERAIHTAQTLADSLGDSYGDGTDFVYHKMSGILQLKSRGYLHIGEPQKTLSLHDELKRQIDADANLWLDFRLHLYRARAYLMMGEIEDCIGAAQIFFQDVKEWHSPHRTARGYELLEEIDNAGYGHLKVVRDFKEQVQHADAQRKKTQGKHSPGRL
jgi:tetratricopeptide (TPR) repeat protein